MAYDIIGDVHGHADALEALLKKMGYRLRSGAWKHSDPARTVIFVGDLIDRGSQQLKTLNIVRPMVDCGSAQAVMGNHEFNAIAWATGDPVIRSNYLRPHSEKNRKQHQQFLKEVTEGSPDHRQWIRWFMDLPLWIEEEELQVVHACWSPTDMAVLRPLLPKGTALMTADLLNLGSEKGHPVYEALEVILKGIEAEIPDGRSFLDKDGHLRHHMRVQWWNIGAKTFQDAYQGPPGVTVSTKDLPRKYLIEVAKPTFIGHYWLPPDSPLEARSSLVACVDFSVANHGPLVAYQFDGEKTLSTNNFVSVSHGWS